MTGMFLPEGRVTVAKLLSGKNIPVNGMYVEYSRKKEATVTNKDAAYFQRLLKDEDPCVGYARIAVSGYEVKEDSASVVFTGLLVDSDYIKPIEPGAIINAVTLCHFNSSDTTDDTLIYTMALPSPIKPVDGSLITIRACLSFGVVNNG